MKRIILYVICIMLSVSAIAQETPKLYDESLDGVQQIKAATEQAAKESYESNRKSLSEKYQKLQKNAPGDGISIQSPVD